MNELIKINYDNPEKPVVSGRELHAALGVDTPYHKWFPRMCEYGFSHERDFWTKMSESTGGRPSTDHQLTIPWQKKSVCCRGLKRVNSSDSISSRLKKLGTLPK